MRALDRKLLRDLWALRMQALTISLVVASGVGGFVGSLSTHDSLLESRERYYADARFADVFSSARRAPDAVGQRLGELPDVAEVQTQLVFDTQISLEGVRQPLAGRMIGTDVDRLAEGVNRVTLRAGRWPAPNSDEVLVNQAFADARSLGPGSVLTALLDGRRQALQVVGVALSPEYIYATTDALLSDDRSFGIFWMDRERLAAAFDMDGAFNSVALKLRAGASTGAAIQEVDRVLAPYGSRGAHARADQASNKVLQGEIQQQRAFGVFLPTVFLAVAVFILNVVLGRQVATQRDQIAALKALGYEDRSIVAHYLWLSVVIVGAGIAIGLALGHWLGHYMTGMYTDFFHFPRFYYSSSPWTVLGAAAACLSAAMAGSWHAVRGVISLRAAEAMRPPSPPAYRPILLERMGLGALASPASRMILRSVERRPVRSLLTVLGIASAVAILVAGTWWKDAIDYLLEVQFNAAQPADVYVGFTEVRGPAVVHELARLPGVLRSEASRSVPVRLHAGHRSYRTAVQGMEPGAQLRRLVDDRLNSVPLTAGGALLTDRLAKALQVQPGDTLRVEFLEGERRERELTVTGVVRELMGMGVYMDLESLSRLAGDGPLVNSGALRTDGSDLGELYDRLKRMPGVAAVFVKSALLEYTRDTSAANILFFTTVLTAFAAAIAVGVVYNSARIALAERAWELATLRVLGFTQREVAVLLLAELGVEFLLGVPLGFVGGYHLAGALVSATSAEHFTIPMVIRPSTYAYAGLTMLAAGIASAWIVQRRLARLDLVGVLKTRE
ncbi:MAG TPA: FtsX-like permease family protein [Quisquiliibacterium sp.]|nr:FtsX-like permease family protein [Quisquiliibacterium sp.]